MHPIEHADSSVLRFGGEPDDYLAIHEWFDESKAHHADFRHRALRHHSQGIFEAERKFGTVIYNSEGGRVPVRVIGEQHVREDLGRIPSLSDWLRGIGGELQPWMFSSSQRSRECRASSSTTTDQPQSSEAHQQCPSTSVASAIPWTTSAVGSQS